jgi:hypothetical protein
MEDFQIRQAADAVMMAHGVVMGERWAIMDDWAQLLDEVVFDRESEVERMIDGPEHVESVVLSKVEVGALLAGSEGVTGLMMKLIQIN